MTTTRHDAGAERGRHARGTTVTVRPGHSQKGLACRSAPNPSDARRPAGTTGGCAARRLPAVLLACVLLAYAHPALGQYLAVFVDRRILPITGARLIGTMRIRLDLPKGAYIEVPLARLDRVIEDQVEPSPRPIPKPSCGAEFKPAPLPRGTPFAAEITDAAKRANLDPRLVAAVVAAESAFNPYAVSRVGAGGLMQLMPSVWLAQGVESPYDPRTNLRIGCSHLRSLLDRFGELPLALAAYNAGVATVERSGGIPPYRETRDFVRRVLAWFCPARESGAG
jgi:hypothetical protein